MYQQLIEMRSGDFAEWAEETFGVDYDNVAMWDMARDMNGMSMPEGFEIGQGSTIPAALYDLLIARKAHRSPALATAKAEVENEVRALAIQPTRTRADWQRLVELGYATCDVDDNDGDMTTSYGLNERGERLARPGYRAPGLYDDQVEE